MKDKHLLKYILEMNGKLNIRTVEKILVRIVFLNTMNTGQTIKVSKMSIWYGKSISKLDT